jgi:flagellar L-ring protein precursor FlgH
MIKKHIIALAAFILFPAVMLRAENLSGDLNSLYTNQKLYKTGDIIKVYIHESATASQEADTSLSKDAGINGGLAGPGTLNYAGNLKFQQTHNGSGNAKQSGLLDSILSAQVTEIKPNGILVIKGDKEVELNGNKQKISITGEVNPIDIMADNTVPSSNVSNARIDYSGDGPIGSKNHVGVLSQILDWLWIF